MHCHTNRHSTCSVVDPVTLIKQIVMMNLQGAIITEHGYVWTEDEIKDLRLRAEVNNTFLILAGQEVETDLGHVLVYGPSQSISGLVSLEDLRKKFPNAALVWAHPFRRGRIPAKEDITNPVLDGLEIFSMNQNLNENYLGLEQWHKFKFTALSGSDAHEQAKAGVFPTQFDHPVITIEDVVSEIKHSRCRPFFKEIPKSGSNVTVTEITIGTKGADEWRNRLIVRNINDRKDWDKTKKSVELTKQIYDSGFKESVFRVPKIIEENEKERLIIEEGQRGKSLYDVLLKVAPKTGLKYFELSAVWLARLHNLKLEAGTAQATISKEQKRFESYLKHFIETGNPYIDKAKSLIDFVRREEEKLFESEKKSFVCSHGDFHPKNIIVGQDKAHDPETVFVSVIDFGSSMMLPTAFDVGYFLSQFCNQFDAHPELLKNYNEKMFVDAYIKEAKETGGEFIAQVKLFKLRANLSIASFLISVGKGESKDMERIIQKSIELKKELL